MSEVHDLIADRGRRAAIDAGWSPQVVDAAAAYLSDEDRALALTYSGWATCSLPYRRLKADEIWRVSTDRVSLMVEPGRREVAGTGEVEWVGVPFGAYARLILIYLQSQAVRTRSREIELGGSMREWLRRIGVEPGGSTGRDVRAQAERISRCRLSFHLDIGKRQSGLVNTSIVDRALFLDTEERGPQGRLSLETARLSEGFYEQLKRSAVPLEEAAIKAISDNSQAIDIYVWLAYRLHVLTADLLVPWPSLKTQFGSSTKEMYHFKPRFRASLALAAAVYPDAKVEESDRGMVLKPSPPPVAPRAVQVLALTR